MSARLCETAALGVELWNDSCAHGELADAVAAGLVGATSNPVIVAAAVHADPARWHSVVDALVAADATASEHTVAARLYDAVVTNAAAQLAPVHAASRRERGWLCAQVSASLWRDAAGMVAHGRALALLADNVAIKLPTVAAGLVAMEELVAAGVRINATVSFTVSQAVAAAEAIARGERRAGKRVPSWVTVMVGRVDDHVKRVASPDLPHADVAGIAVFKRARRAFAERGLEATLLAAAYRHEEHWRALVGPGVVQSIPYTWWRRFAASDAPVTTARLDDDVDASAIEALRALPDFRRAYDDGVLAVAEFSSYGASVHTLRQFLEGQGQLVRIVRDRMLAP